MLHITVLYYHIFQVFFIKNILNFLNNNAQFFIVWFYNNIQGGNMTLLKPITSSEMALRSYIKDAAKKANLSLSEVNALNEKFGLSLEYQPKGDFIQLTRYGHLKNDEFIKQCSDEAVELSQKTGLAIAENIKRASKSSFEMNLSSALRKMKSILKG